MASIIQETSLKSFFIYNPQLGQKEGTEHLKILFYYPDAESENRKVRNIGLCEALVNFTKTFNPSKCCEAVHTQKLKQVFYEPEKDIWMVMTVTVPTAEIVNNGEKSVEYNDHHIHDSLLDAALKQAYCMFKLFNGTITSISMRLGVDGLKKRLDKFYERYLGNVAVNKIDIFSVFQGIQFLPLDKYMYLKAHCFVNLVETTFRNIQRTVLLYKDQLVWSGLEQEDIKTFYQYLMSWLYLTPDQSASSSSSSSSFNPAGASVTASLPSTSSSFTRSTQVTSSFSSGGFVIGAGSQEGTKSPWVYVTIDGALQSLRLFVYSVGYTTMCFFVQTDNLSPSQDFAKRLGTFLGPRLAQLSREIAEFRDRAKPPGVEQQYRFLYFNEMNLAVKSPLLSRRPPFVSISPDAMRLITELNAEYDSIDEGETVVRTTGDYWVICRKTGHRRFFVVITQKSANFAEVTDEVRKLCQREFTNIFFLD